MSVSRKNRVVTFAFGTIAAIVLYFTAYFACVSVQTMYAVGIKGPSGARIIAYYKVGFLLQDFASYVFEPARLCDACYFRPELWNNAKWNNKDLPLERDKPSRR